ncbi:unnamed protein product [Symbiodinium natans]|uniref:Tyrosine-protein kinase ephrin type A/B receptor-like domain-containing protein n=1 Tax=Symbiodinium natans TaxID=878477 RepID=A0A812S165_9DINO|nr:unnamed protein product [Symbiodinium natans]
MHTIGVLAYIALIARSARARCFENGVEPQQVANFVADGDVFPLGIAVGDWPAAHLLSGVSQILIEEQLGVNVTLATAGGNTVDGFYAMAGCTTPSQVTDRGCGATTTRMHLHLEAWVSLYQVEYDQIQKDYPTTAPTSLGSIGYTGSMSMYLPKRILDNASISEGIPLEFYRAYNSSWYEPSHYFDNLGAVNLSQVRRCRDTRFVQSRNMQTYVEVTNDIDGVEDNGGLLMARCQDGYFWRAPACRHNVALCVPVLTGGTGWAVEEVMQKATSFSMPLALGVAATSEDYRQIPLQVRSLFMWFRPDDAFLDLSPVEIRFPRYDRAAWLSGDLRTAPEQVKIEKLVSQNLVDLAPAVLDLIQKMRWSVDDVNHMMMDMKTSNDSPATVACRWLTANPDIWSSWLVGETACFAGFGLFDASSGYVAHRDGTAELACRPCESGSYSQELQDAKGTTHICQLCRPGTFQKSGASTSCEPCSEGNYQDEEGALDCKRCPMGRFQDEKGKSVCNFCGNGTTTLGLGSLSEQECGCLPGTINVGHNSSCQACPEGLSCPVLSTVSSLLNGSTIAHELTPQIRAGYFSSMEEPLEIFKCIPASHCPGGPPNTCLGGLSALPCAACGEREYFDGEECVICVSSRKDIFVLGFVAGLVGLVLAYYLLNSPMSAKASVMLTTTTAMGMMVMTLQKVGVIGNMTVDFPFNVQDLLQALQVFILDLDLMGFPCVASPDPVRRYLATVMVFPAVVVGILFCLALSKFLPKKWRWSASKSLNLIGQFLQIGYTTMSVTAMVPMTCYSHPNGRHSLLKFPDVFCGTSEHSTMLAFGVALLAFGVLGFLCLCAWAAIQVPLWSSQGLSERVSAFRFLLARFRLDGWWYGVPLLVRGSLLNLPVVLATDYPPVQIVSMSVILVVFMIVQTTFWPWKPPLINALDCWISACVILLVVSAAMGLPELSDDMLSFRDIFTMLVIVLLFGSVLFTLGCVGVSLLLRSLGIQEIILTLGPIPQAQRVAQALQSISAELSEADAAEIKSRVEDLAVYDVTQISRCITVVAKEVLCTDSPAFDFTRRVSAKSFEPGRKGSVKKEDQKVQATGSEDFVGIAPTESCPMEQEGADLEAAALVGETIEEVESSLSAQDADQQLPGDCDEVSSTLDSTPRRTRLSL